jgi:thioredoxin-like negative regulator of GroEL
MFKKSAFYLFAILFIFSGQFLLSSSLVTGHPPEIKTTTLTGHPAMQNLQQGPALIYLWAEWCGVCRTMQSNVSAVLSDYPGLTVAVRSGNQQQITTYLQQQQLNWPVVNDSDGAISQNYGSRSVPALFFLNKHGQIVFTSIGYTSEWGLRFRLWLAGLL